MIPWHQSVGALFDEIAERFSSKEAIAFKDIKISYKEMGYEVNRIAKGLVALGIKPGDKIAIWMTNRPEWILSMFAIAKIGAIVIPINARFKTAELTYTLQHSESACLILKDRTERTDYLGMLLEICPEICSSTKWSLSSPKLPSLKRVVCTSPQKYHGVLGLAEVVDLGDRQVPEETLNERQGATTPENILLIQYTSGTTAMPKGAMLSHDQVIRVAHTHGENLTISPEDRVYCPLPFFHVAGLILTALVPLLSGATLVMDEYFDAKMALRSISSEGCTAMNAFATHWLDMYEHPDFNEFNIGSLQKGWCAGPPEMIRKVYEDVGVKKIVNTYGLSESAGNVGTTRVDDSLEVRMHWNGLPLRGTEVKIIDVDTGQDLGIGQEGEICFRGFNVMKGYYKDPEGTAGLMDADGWLRTGDTGMMNERGYFKYTGRVKDMIKVGGENVSALEIEDFILRHPAVKEVQVIGVPDPRLAEVPMASIILKEAANCTERDIIDFCLGRIARFKIPRYIRFVKEYPMTASGKVQKVKLREMLIQELGSS